MKHVKDFSSGLSTKYTALTDNMITGSGYARGVEFNLALERRKISARFNYTLSESKRKFAEINNGKSFFNKLVHYPFKQLWSMPPTISVHALLLTVYGHFLQGFIPHSLSE